MAIDIQSERLISLRDLATWIREHMGTQTGYQCVHGWATRGRRFRGRVVRLETAAGPGGLRSSLEALERFSAELTALRLGLPAQQPGPAGATAGHPGGERIPPAERFSFSII